MHTWIVHCAASTAVIYKCCFNTRNVCCAVLEEIYPWSLWTVDSACLITGGNPACRSSCALGYLELNLSLKGRWVSFRKSWGWRDGLELLAEQYKEPALCWAPASERNFCGLFSTFPCSVDCLSAKAVNRIKEREGWRQSHSWNLRES